MSSLILASASPRRQELLKRMVSDFSIETSVVEEIGSDALPDWVPEPLRLEEPFHVPLASDPRIWAWRKGIDVFSHATPNQREYSVFLAADTVVIAPGELLGKPKNAQDAERMLSLLRNRHHFVATGFVLLKQEEQSPVTLHSEVVLSLVTMRDFTLDELQGYVATGEYVDKAGAYAVQGLGGRLVERVDGCLTNVIGLPLCAVRAALITSGVELPAAPSSGYCNYCKRRSGNHETL